jgi:hypothetical protein
VIDQFKCLNTPAKSTVRNRQSAIDLTLFIFSLLLYTSTLIPSVLSADNGEFQLVASKLGIAHPPGYPLYTIIGFLFSRFFTSPAYALNLLSALLAAITLIIVNRSVRVTTGSTIAGLSAALILGASTTFWAQATTANIRMPTALFTALCAFLCVRCGLNRSATSTPPYFHTSDRYLNLFALTFSLGLTHHPSLIFPGLFFILYLILIDPSLLTRPRRWIKPILFFALGLLIFLYLPLRAATGGTLADGEPTTYLTQPDKLLDHILARGFEGDFFYFISTQPELLDDRLSLLPTLFNFQFNTGALMLGILGVVMLALRNKRLLIMLFGGVILHTFITLTYRAPQTVEYALPAYVLFAILIGCGVGYTAHAAHSLLHNRLKTAIQYVVIAFALLTALTRGLDNWPSYRWLAQNEDTRAYAEALLRDVPPNALILSNWHWANPMWYLQQVEGLRSDVEVRYVFPRGEPLADTWLRSIDDGIASGKPVVANMAFRRIRDGAFYFFEPISREAFLVTSAPRNDRPEGFTSLEANFSDQFTLLGYRLLDDHTTPGEPLTLFLAWRVEQQPDRDYSFFAHLVDAAGRVIGQSDHAVQPTRYLRGDVIVERFFIAPLPGTPPGDYTLITGIYSVENNSIVPLSDSIEITRVSIDPAASLIPHPASPAIALSHGIYFLDSRTATPPHLSTLKPGDELILDLTFLSTRPLTRDFVVSIQMIGDDYSWVVISDSIPALGAIPTLKWIAGSTIVDRHVIDIPREAPPGAASAWLILYDNFTQQPLSLLDAQLIQQSPSIPLGVWMITP